MKIRSKKTNLTHTVDKAGWEQIKARGDAAKYVVISNESPEQATPPADTNAADYNNIVKQATKAFKSKKYEEAKKLYEQAAAINSTDLITEKLAEINGILDLQE